MRSLIPWILVGAYVLILIVAGRSVYAIRDNQRTAVTDQLETTLADAVAAWEEELLQTMTGWMDAIHADGDRAVLLQHQMRRRATWFNSLYIWQIQQRVRVGPKDLTVPAEVTFPRSEVAEDRDAALSRYCIHRARILAADPRIEPEDVAQAYVVGCRHEPLPIRMHAASQAADLLDNHGEYASALNALEAAGVPDALTLTRATSEGIPPFRLTIHRIQQASLLTKLGRTEPALDLLERVGTEITLLDAPNAEPLLKYVRWPVLPNLERSGRQAAASRIEAMTNRAERRVAAYRELEERIVGLVPRPDTTELPQPIYDQYSNRPFILWYGWEGTQGVALQLEQQELIEDFLLNKSVSRLRPWLVVTDNSGAVLAGESATNDLAANIPFRIVLNHLRVGMDAGAVDDVTLRMKGQWIGQGMVLVLCAVLGFVALFVQIRATRQQTELLQRQRQFTTRVTHELKTPLAGIRVMAENLELGAFKGDAQRMEMASRIVAETDRLTARVEEVLDAARERTIPDPEPFDPEEAVFLALDHWGPRLEAAGVQLTADLNPTSEVMGDMNALRDTVGCLLDNALKYRKEDRDDGRVELSLDQVGKKVRIAVTDNGIGVPVKLRASIFDRFVRVEGPNRGMAGGYGLGLAQVAQTVKAHRGTVRCEEGIEGGARFVIDLPALDA